MADSADIWTLPTSEQLAQAKTMPAQSESIGERGTTGSMNPEDRARILADRDSLARRLEHDTQSYESEQRHVHEEDEAAARAAEDALQRAEDEERAAQQAQPDLIAPTMHWTPHSIIDPHDYQNWGMALLAMGLIGGVASRGNWSGVSASLNGALQGYLDGNKQRAENEWNTYSEQFKEALEHDKAEQKRFDDILRSKTMSVNQMLRRVQEVAAATGRHDVYAAAQERSLDRVQQQLDAMDEAIGRVEVEHSTNSETLRFGLNKSGMTQTGFDHLTPEGYWLVKNLVVNGNNTLMQLVSSRYGGFMAAKVVNDLGQYMHEHNINPLTITQAHLNNQVQLSIQRTVGQRKAGVERLTGSVKQAEDRIAQLVQRVNGNGAMSWNAFENLVRNQLGSQQLSELTQLMASIGRQYIEAVTMPGSNAQLHASQSEWAQQHFNPNMNVSQYIGTFRAINYEIDWTHKALDATLTESRQHVTDTGLFIPMESAPPPIPADIAKQAGINPTDPGYNPEGQGNPAPAGPSAAAGPPPAAPPASAGPPRTPGDVLSKYNE